MAHLPIKFEVATNVSAYEEMQSRFGAPVDEAAVFAKQTADNLNMSGLAGDVGQIQTNTGATRQNEFDNIKDRKKRNKQLREMMSANDLINHLQGEIEQLQGQYDANQKKIDKLDDKIEATETILLLIASDEFDPSNKDHQKLLDRADIDADQSKEEIKKEAKDNLKDDKNERDGLVQENKGITEQINIRHRAIKDLRNGRTPEAVMADLEKQGVTVEIKAGDDLELTLSIENTDFESRKNQNQQEIDALDASGADVGKPDSKAPNNAETTPSSSVESTVLIDEEIESFMQELAAGQAFYGADEIAEVMQEQINGLSEEAREVLLANEDTKFLFDETKENLSPTIGVNEDVSPDNATVLPMMKM